MNEAAQAKEANAAATDLEEAMEHFQRALQVMKVEPPNYPAVAAIVRLGKDLVQDAEGCLERVRIAAMSAEYAEKAAAAE